MRTPSEQQSDALPILIEFDEEETILLRRPSEHVEVEAYVLSVPVVQDSNGNLMPNQELLDPVIVVLGE